MKMSRYLALATVLAVCAPLAAMPRAAQARHGGVVRAPSIRVLSMVSPTTGWALEAAAILHTTNGATLWLNVTPPGVAVTQNSLAFALDARAAWVTATRADAAHTPVVAWTTDGGHTWRVDQAPLPSDAAGIGRITFVDRWHGWLLVSLGAGAGSEGVQILRTADGGIHWVTVSRTASVQPAAGSLPLHGIKTGITFRDATVGWATAAGAGPTNAAWLYITRDAGHTWQSQSLTFPTPYQQGVPMVSPPRFFTPRDGLLPVVLNAPALAPAVVFYVTHDGGSTWSGAAPLPYTATAGSPSWDFGDLDHGWVAWGTTLHTTVDGGRHWSAIVPTSGFQGVTQLNFVNARVAWALSTGPAGPALLLKTLDGGRTWSRLSAYVTYPPDRGVHVTATRR